MHFNLSEWMDNQRRSLLRSQRHKCRCTCRKLRSPILRISKRSGEQGEHIDRWNPQRRRASAPHMRERLMHIEEDNVNLELSGNVPRCGAGKGCIQAYRQKIVATGSQRHPARDVRVKVEWIDLQQRIKSEMTRKPKS